MILTADLKRELMLRIGDAFECWTEGTHDDAEVVQVVYNILTEFMEKWYIRLIDDLSEELAENTDSEGSEDEQIVS